MIDFSILVMIGLLIGWVLAIAIVYSTIELSERATTLMLALLITWLAVFTVSAVFHGFTNVTPSIYYGSDVGGFRGNVVERTP